MSAKRVSAAKSKQKSLRQKRQNRSVASAQNSRLTGRYMLKHMTIMVKWLAEHRKGGYRWIQGHTSRKFGWWQHVGTGNYKTIKPTKNDYDMIKRIYDLLQDDVSTDNELLDTLLEIFEYRGKLDAALSRAVTIVRRRADA